MESPYVVYLDEVDSTNRYALEFFDELPDAALVAARVQYAGRGRMNRRWQSPPDENIYASFVMKKLPDINWQYAVMASSLAVLELLRKAAPETNFWLKWPNDIFCAERKICGMLGEIKSGPDNKPVGIIAGAGININMPPTALAAIGQPAASLFAETGKRFNVRELTDILAALMGKYYGIGIARPRELYERWRHENLLIGRRIVLASGDCEFSGVVLDLDDSGGMVFEHDGKQSVFYSGDVRIDRKSINL